MRQIQCNDLPRRTPQELPTSDQNKSWYIPTKSEINIPSIGLQSKYSLCTRILYEIKIHNWKVVVLRSPWVADWNKIIIPAWLPLSASLCWTSTITKLPLDTEENTDDDDDREEPFLDYPVPPLRPPLCRRSNLIIYLTEIINVGPPQVSRDRQKILKVVSRFLWVVQQSTIFHCNLSFNCVFWETFPQR